MKILVLVIAAAETVTGAVVLASPATASRFLFGSEIAGAGAAIARFAGICLIALGLACWPRPVADGGRQGIWGLLVYSALATLYLAIIAISGDTVGPLLWPAAVLHGLLTALLARAFLKGKEPQT